MDIVNQNKFTPDEIISIHKYINDYDIRDFSKMIELYKSKKLQDSKFIKLVNDYLRDFTIVNGYSSYKLINNGLDDKIIEFTK